MLRVIETDEVFVLIVQFGGLDCPGKVAALSTRLRSSIKASGFLERVLHALRKLGDEQVGRDGSRWIDTVIEAQLLFVARLGLDDSVSALLEAGADKNTTTQILHGTYIPRRRLGRWRRRAPRWGRRSR